MSGVERDLILAIRLRFRLVQNRIPEEQQP
jgi:hypothetical protein